jgi:hypothetical protein
MKNSYLNLSFVFGSVAVDDDMHFKIVKLEWPPIVWFGGNGMSSVFFQELSETGGLYFM